MKTLFAFIKKDLLEQARTGKLMVLGILFIIFGIMNPAVAKLTPWLLEVMADSMAESGMTVTLADVTAMDSWVQFFKNVPMALIAFVLLEGSIFTREYRDHLVLSLTKGPRRYNAVVSKAFVLVLLWTVGYWCCFGITYAYNEYFWDNSVAANLTESVCFYYVFGLFIMALLVLFSVLSASSSGVLLGVGGVTMALYLMGLVPKLAKYLPTRLTDGASLIYGAAEPREYLSALMITAAAAAICLGASIPLFNKKQL